MPSLAQGLLFAAFAMLRTPIRLGLSLALLALCATGAGAAPVVVQQPHLGPLLLEARARERAPVRGYVRSLKARGIFAGETARLEAWSRTVPPGKALDSVRKPGRPLIGILLNDVHEILGNPEALRYQRAYANAIRQAGGTPIFLPPGARSASLDHIDHLVLSGGEDIEPSLYGEVVHGARPTDRARDVAERNLLHHALDKGLCVDGVCRGMQMMNVALGGTLVQDLPSAGHKGHADGARHPVKLAPDSDAARLLGVTRLRAVPSFHHESIDRLARGLRVTGRSPDGVVEAIESLDGRLHATQFHPELSRSPTVRALWKGVVQRAEATRAARAARQDP